MKFEIWNTSEDFRLKIQWGVLLRYCRKKHNGCKYILKFSLIFYPLTTLLDFFRALYAVEAFSNRRPPLDGRGPLLEIGYLKGRVVY